MEHQDWHTITINKVVNEEKKKEINKKKDKLANNLDYQLNKKEAEGKLKHKKITKELSKSIRDARCSQKLTQKDLANKVNLPLKIINDIENGNAKYNPGQINKIKRSLKI